jgi:hypothetical protein
MLTNRKIIYDLCSFKCHKSCSSKYKYSSDKETENFYIWVQKLILPLELHNNTYADGIRDSIYESINGDSSVYYASTVSFELYLKENGLPVEDVHRLKKIFRNRLKILNKMEKAELLEHYNQNKISISLITNNE